VAGRTAVAVPTDHMIRFALLSSFRTLCWGGILGVSLMTLNTFLTYGPKDLRNTVRFIVFNLYIIIYIGILLREFGA